MPDIVVIGGGITGTATAHALALEGYSVTLVERRGIAAMASGWTLAGVRQSGRHPAELPLAQAAVALWQDLGERLDADVEYRRKGNLRLARTEAEVPVIRDVVESQRRLGLSLDFLPDNRAIRAIAPALSDSILAASFCATDGHANPAKTTNAFADVARRAGASIREGVSALALKSTGGRITGVLTSEGTIAAGRVVVAAGVNTPSLLAPLGLDLPLAVKIVSVVQTAPLPPCFEQVFGVANADCAGRQQVDGRMRFTNGLGDWPGDPDDWSEAALAPTLKDTAKLVKLVSQVLPAAGTATIARTWGGLIDLTPDALPVIDTAPGIEGLTVAAGFSGHGFCLGPISGLLCADLTLGRAPRLDLSAFRFDRFAGRRAPQAELTLHG